MNKELQNIINCIKAEGKDYNDFNLLINRIKENDLSIHKDEILDLVANDYRLQLHTTPNNIALLFNSILRKFKFDNAIDICCGTGNILYYLQDIIDDLTGVEISENIAKLTSYFVPDINIITADTFKYPFTRKYDLVVGNLPWGLKVKLNDKIIPGEEAFIRKSFEISSDDAILVFLVPYSVLISKSFKNFRNEFFGNLKQVIGLPENILRYVRVKTALLIFERKTTPKIQVSLLNDFDKLCEEYNNTEKINLLPKNILDRWDPEYILLKENKFYKELENFKTVKLSDLAEVIKGKSINSKLLTDYGDFLYLKPINIQNEKLIIDKHSKYFKRNVLKESDYNCIIQPGDIIISTVFSDFKMYTYEKNDPPAFASNNIAIIRSSEQDYINSYLKTIEGKQVFKIQADNIKKGITIPYIATRDLLEIKIPILPIAELNILGNKSIEKANTEQLEESLTLLKEYKQHVIMLKHENKDLKLLLNFLNNRFDKVENQLNIINKKLDNISFALTELKIDFNEIKSLPRDEEERLFKLYCKIDQKLDFIYNEEKETIEIYIEEIKRWLDLWEILDIQSKKILPIAEFLFDKLSMIVDADFSPFVVQYCRTIENEILKKLFENYHTNGLVYENRYELTEGDLKNEKTKRFAEMVRKNKINYTLGEMNYIISLLKEGGKTLYESKLLKHFRNFTIEYFDNKILEAKFIEDINILTNEYRNKAAHPSTMDLDMAKHCQELLRRSLNIFLESLKDRSH